jgi:hypothetical protein
LWRGPRRPRTQNMGSKARRAVVDQEEAQPRSSPRGNLPIQVSSFVGCERELDELEGRVASSRLLTLTGPGDCGKTRLALQTAAQLAEDFEDGVGFVELASLSAPELVAEGVARGLGVRPAWLSPTEALLDHVEHKERRSCCWTTASTSSKGVPGWQTPCSARARGSRYSRPAGRLSACPARGPGSFSPSSTESIGPGSRPPPPATSPTTEARCAGSRRNISAKRVGLQQRWDGPRPNPGRHPTARVSPG